jgi:hypothetical protein
MEDGRARPPRRCCQHTACRAALDVNDQRPVPARSVSIYSVCKYASNSWTCDCDNVWPKAGIMLRRSQ